uniref:CRAL-TRIO domain-containing protein n=2 Tax=Phaeomonas parva TaxID=124430 RepID=A0A7S1U2U2_9STRA|mmetsp:Transcript_28450/g.91079  ORF Transcript_28450/g.91079 Transcript_28450/m.91079 type:complete len:344 (+) Transcript_28450:351-1382(+)
MLGPRGALVLKSLTVLLVICSAILGRALVEGSVVGDFSAARRSATDVPRNILEAENFNRDRARIRWRRTLAWREKEGCDQILEQPHKYFHQIKKHYPHSVHLKDKDGLYTYWERPGGVDVPGLRRDGVNADKLFWHYIWHTEYTWQVIAPEDGAKVTVVQDYGGFTPEKVSMEVLNFVKRAVGMTSEYYPERADKILIVNVPEWYRGVYNILKNFMSKKMLQRIRIFTSSEVQKGALLKYIPAQNLPESYGGKSKLALGESKEEKRMRAYVDKLVKRGGRPRRRRWKQAAEAVEGIAEVATKKPHRRNLWGQLITEDIQPAPPAEEPEEAPRRGFWKQLLRQD